MYPHSLHHRKSESKLCQAMYDKVYGTNGQDILCKTDADCKNPCRLLCCGDVGRLEQVICKDGTCALGVSSKCNFCFSGKNPEACTLPDEFNTTLTRQKPERDETFVTSAPPHPCMGVRLLSPRFHKPFMEGTSPSLPTRA